MAAFSENDPQIKASAAILKWIRDILMEKKEIKHLFIHTNLPFKNVVFFHQVSVALEFSWVAAKSHKKSECFQWQLKSDFTMSLPDSYKPPYQNHLFHQACNCIPLIVLSSEVPSFVYEDPDFLVISIPDNKIMQFHVKKGLEHPDDPNLVEIKGLGISFH